MKEDIENRLGCLSARLCSSLHGRVWTARLLWLCFAPSPTRIRNRLPIFLFWLLALPLQLGCHATKPGAWLVLSPASRTEDSLSLKDRLQVGKELPSQEAARLKLTLADEELQSGLEKEAQAHYEQSRQLDPTQKGIAHRLALIHDSRGEHGLAQTEYNKALKENPRDSDLLNDLGYSFYSQGDWKKAEEYYRKALEIREDSRYWNNLGLALGQQSRYREALESFRKATDEPRAHGNIGFIFLAQGRKEHARHAYQKALELDPGYERARVVLAQLENDQKTATQVPNAKEQISTRSNVSLTEPATSKP